MAKKLVTEAQKAAEGKVELVERVAEVTALESERQRDSLELMRLRSDTTVLERDRERMRAQVGGRCSGRAGMRASVIVNSIET